MFIHRGCYCLWSGSQLAKRQQRFPLLYFNSSLRFAHRCAQVLKKYPVVFVVAWVGEGRLEEGDGAVWKESYAMFISFSGERGTSVWVQPLQH